MPQMLYLHDSAIPLLSMRPEDPRQMKRRMEHAPHWNPIVGYGMRAVRINLVARMQRVFVQPAKQSERPGWAQENAPPRLFGQGATHCFEHVSPYRRMIGVLTTTLSFALSLFERFTSSHLRYERRAERFLVIGDDGIYLQCLCRHSDSPIFVIGLIGLQCLKDENAGQVH